MASGDAAKLGVMRIASSAGAASFAAIAAVGLAACGSSHATTVATSTQAPASTSTTTAHTTTHAATTTAAPAPLQAEAASTAAGDIPDNQVFVVYRDARFTMKYPEGWVERRRGTTVTFRNINNIVRVVVGTGGAPTVASVRRELGGLSGTTVTIAPHPVRLGATNAVEATYRTTSAPNPVTGKRVTLTVDRYEIGRGSRRATVDLGTPVGVDNVDAYRLMIQSFTWR